MSPKIQCTEDMDSKVYLVTPGKTKSVKELIAIFEKNDFQGHISSNESMDLKDSSSEDHCSEEQVKDEKYDRTCISSLSFEGYNSIQDSALAVNRSHMDKKVGVQHETCAAAPGKDYGEDEIQKCPQVTAVGIESPIELIRANFDPSLPRDIISRNPTSEGIDTGFESQKASSRRLGRFNDLFKQPALNRRGTSKTKSSSCSPKWSNKVRVATGKVVQVVKNKLGKVFGPQSPFSKSSEQSPDKEPAAEDTAKKAPSNGEASSPYCVVIYSGNSTQSELPRATSQRDLPQETHSSSHEKSSSLRRRMTRGRLVLRNCAKYLGKKHEPREKSEDEKTPWEAADFNSHFEQYQPRDALNQSFASSSSSSSYEAPIKDETMQRAWKATLNEEDVPRPEIPKMDAGISTPKKNTSKAAPKPKAPPVNNRARPALSPRRKRQAIRAYFALKRGAQWTRP